MKNKSFTLIELLVVIVIIGVLAGVIMVTTSSSVSNATLARAKAFSSNVSNSMLLNLVSEWTFDEPQVGNITKDSWGVNNGTVYSATTPIEYWNTSSNNCVFGGCYEFNGDDYIDCGFFSRDLSTTSATLSVWVRATYTSSKIFFVDGKSKLGLGFYDYNGDKNLIVVSGDDTNRENILQINDWQNNVWNYVVITYDNGHNPTGYLNGALMPIGGQTNYWTEATNNILIGKRTTGNNFSGLVDDFKVYSIALSQSQIKQNYIAGLNSLLGKGLISESEFKEKLDELGSNK